MSNVTKQFSRFAHQYNTHNIIQAKVAKTLVELLPLDGYESILDIGCGSGEVFKNLIQHKIDFKSFTAFDSSMPMLALHPNKKSVVKVCADFNDIDFLDTLPDFSYDIILSSSALQWSKDLTLTIAKTSTLSRRFHAAIFTSGTFKTLHQIADIPSPIYSAEILQKEILKYYDKVSFALHHYTLSFNSNREMFQYIKKSGVSSGEKRLTYKQTKQLMKIYPLNYLEFEVLFVSSEL